MSDPTTPLSATSPRKNSKTSLPSLVLFMVGIVGMCALLIGYSLFTYLAPQFLDSRLHKLSENSRGPIYELALSLSPDGKVLAYGTDSTAKVLVNFETNERVYIGHCRTVAWLTNDVIACYNGLDSNGKPEVPWLYHYPDMTEISVLTTLDTVSETAPLTAYKHDDMSKLYVFVTQNGQWYWVTQMNPLLREVSAIDRTLPLAGGSVHPSPNGVYRLEGDPRRAHHTRNGDAIRVVNIETNEVYYERPYGNLLVLIGWTYDGCGLLFSDYKSSIFAGNQEGYVYRLDVPCNPS